MNFRRSHDVIEVAIECVGVLAIRSSTPTRRSRHQNEVGARPQRAREPAGHLVIRHTFPMRHRDPHRRENPLSGEWVLVSPQRMERPWQGQLEKTSPASLPAHDPMCFLCPGNLRAGGARNPAYEKTFVFTNDFPALLPDGEGERGTCRVVCYSPHHDLSLGQLTPEQLRLVVEVWTAEYATLGADPHIGHVQIFENRGEVMGASSPHPHGQIWATEHVPMHVAREQEHLIADPDLLIRALAGHADQVIEENDYVVAVVPRWAVWPFETLVTHGVESRRSSVSG